MCDLDLLIEEIETRSFKLAEEISDGHGGRDAENKVDVIFPSTNSMGKAAEPLVEQLVINGVERVVFAVNDRPFALYAEGSLRGGGGRGRSSEAGVGLRAGIGR